MLGEFHMRVYHRTDRAEPILVNGIRDGTGKYMLEIDEPLTGVFVSMIQQIERFQGRSRHGSSESRESRDRTRRRRMCARPWATSYPSISALIVGRRGLPRIKRRAANRIRTSSSTARRIQTLIVERPIRSVTKT